jgi:hypothetical protein
MGVCVNDGDTEDGQGGQKGWSGWGPYAIVYGALAQPCGLVTLAEYSMVYTSTPGFCAAAGSNYKTLTGQNTPGICAAICSSDDACVGLAVGVGSAFDGTCYLYDGAGATGALIGDGTVGTVCMLQTNDVSSGAAADTSTSGLGIWQPTDTESWYSGNGDQGYVEGDCGTTDTRYEGVWDAEHTIWPAAYTAKKGCVKIDGDLAPESVGLGALHCIVF